MCASVRDCAPRCNSAAWALQRAACGTKDAHASSRMHAHACMRAWQPHARLQTPHARQQGLGAAAGHLEQHARLHHARIDDRIGFKKACVEGDSHERALAAVDGAQHELRAGECAGQGGAGCQRLQSGAAWGASAACIGAADAACGWQHAPALARPRSAARSLQLRVGLLVCQARCGALAAAARACCGLSGWAPGAACSALRRGAPRNRASRPPAAAAAPGAHLSCPGTAARS